MEQQEVFLCFSCGAKNRLNGRVESSAKCGKCGEPLFGRTGGVASMPIPQNAKPIGSADPVPSKRKSFLWRTTVFVFFGGILVATIYSATDTDPVQDSINDARKSAAAAESIAESARAATTSNDETWMDKYRIVEPEPTSDPKGDGWTFEEFVGIEATPEPVPVVLPKAVNIAPGLIWNITGRSPEAPFEIITSPGANYFVKLVSYANGQDRVAIYIVGGQRMEVQVPLGRYKMKYCAGQVWLGEGHWFGPGNLTSCSVSETEFNFAVEGDYINGYTVELILQTDGNMETHGIDPSTF